MIASCMIFLASFGVSTELSPNNLYRVQTCLDNMPTSMVKHIPYYVEFYDEENLYTAFRIGWCESRGKSNAYRNDNKDSGVMQFIPNTWNWVAEKYDMPKFNEWVILRFVRQFNENKTYATDFGFEHVPVQYSAYYNIKASSHLAEDIYAKVRWRDWNSSKWCWGDEKKWEAMWRREN